MLMPHITALTMLDLIVTTSKKSRCNGRLVSLAPTRPHLLAQCAGSPGPVAGGDTAAPRNRKLQ